jgi:hypothetical protein
MLALSRARSTAPGDRPPLPMCRDGAAHRRSRVRRGPALLLLALAHRRGRRATSDLLAVRPRENALTAIDPDCDVMSITQPPVRLLYKGRKPLRRLT